MTKLTTILAAGALAGAMGCSANTEPVAGATNGLEMVRKADFYGTTMYFDPATSLRPVAATELETNAHATPVRVVFYRDFAVAWLETAEGPQIGVDGALVGAWPVLEHAEAIAGDVRPGDAPPTSTTPDLGVPRSRVPLPAAGRAPSHPVAVTDVVAPVLPLALIDWAADDSERFRNLQRLEELQPEHPGCI